MKPVKHAKRYARQLLNSVGFDGAQEAIRELGAVNALLEKSPQMMGLLLSPVFTKAEKSAALAAVGKKMNLSEGTVKFVGYLSGVGAAAALGQVTQAATAIYAEKRQMARATVITPTAVEGGYEGRLRASLRKLIGREVELEFVTDRSLLGGVLVKVGSLIYDGSVKGQLRLLKDELVKG